MPSPALTEFIAATRALTSLSGDDRAALLIAARHLYIRAIREHADHTRVHLRAEVAARGASNVSTSVASLLEAALDRTSGAPGDLIGQIAERL